MNKMAPPPPPAAPRTTRRARSPAIASSFEAVSRPETPDLAALLRGTAVGRANGDFTASLQTARAFLRTRDPVAEPWSLVLEDLLTALAERATPLDTLAEPQPMPVHLDSRVEECFEAMLSLIHRQNMQIAELWRIASDFV